MPLNRGIKRSSLAGGVLPVLSVIFLQVEMITQLTAFFLKSHTYNLSAASPGQQVSSQLDTAGNVEFPDSACLGVERCDWRQMESWKILNVDVNSTISP